MCHPAANSRPPREQVEALMQVFFGDDLDEPLLDNSTLLELALSPNERPTDDVQMRLNECSQSRERLKLLTEELERLQPPVCPTRIKRDRTARPMLAGALLAAGVLLTLGWWVRPAQEQEPLTLLPAPQPSSTSIRPAVEDDPALHDAMEDFERDFGNPSPTLIALKQGVTPSSDAVEEQLRSRSRVVLDEIRAGRFWAAKDHLRQLSEQLSDGDSRRSSINRLSHLLSDR